MLFALTCYWCSAAVAPRVSNVFAKHAFAIRIDTICLCGYLCLCHSNRIRFSVCVSSSLVCFSKRNAMTTDKCNKKTATTTICHCFICVNWEQWNVNKYTAIFKTHERVVKCLFGVIRELRAKWIWFLKKSCLPRQDDGYIKYLAYNLKFSLRQDPLSERAHSTK